MGLEVAPIAARYIWGSAGGGAEIENAHQVRVDGLLN
jgi:hypothetical protein